MLMAQRPVSPLPGLTWRSLSQTSLTLEVPDRHDPRRSQETRRRATRRSPGAQNRKCIRSDVMTRSDEITDYHRTSLDELGAAERVSHDRRRAYSMSRFVRVKDEVNRKLKTTRAFQHRPAPRLVSMGDGCTRKIYVVIGSSARFESAQDYPAGNGASHLGGMDRNISDWLKLESVEHGIFSASFPLSPIPTGDLNILVFDSKLQLTVKLENHQRVKGGPKHRIKHLGFMKLPMYLDNDTLEFEMSDIGDNCVIITGKLKGCNNHALTQSPTARHGAGTESVSDSGYYNPRSSPRRTGNEIKSGVFPGRRKDYLTVPNSPDFRSRSHTT